MSRRVVLIAIAVCLVLGGVAWLWQRHQRQADLAASAPPRPDLAAWPDELAERVARGEARLSSGPDRIQALAELSRLYHANGYLAEAARCYEALEAHAPGTPRWLYRHAMILSGYGQNTPAIERLRTIAPGVYLPAGIRLGDILLKEGDIAAAVDIYNAIQRSHPNEPYSLLGLARCDIDRGLWQDARTKLERLVALTNYALGYDLIVPVYERLGQQDRAAEIRGKMRAWGAFRDMEDPWMEELLEDSYDAYQLSLAAGAAERRPDLPLATRRLERAVKLAPDSATLRFQLGMLHLQRKEFTRAREQLEACTRLAPDFADGWAHLSGLHLTVGDRAGSDRTLDEGLRQCPDSPGLHQMKAQRHLQAGRHEEAIAEFKRSIELRPTEADAYVQLGMILMGTGRRSEAVAVFESALVAEPQHPFVLCTLALHAIETNDEPAAVRWISQARQQPRVKEVDLQRVLQAFSTAFGRPAP